MAGQASGWHAVPGWHPRVRQCRDARVHRELTATRLETAAQRVAGASPRRRARLHGDKRWVMARAWPWRATGPRLFTNAEVLEDAAEEVIGGERAGDLPEALLGEPQILGQ